MKYLRKEAVLSYSPISKAQVVMCIRWVDADLQGHEEVIGLTRVGHCNTEQIVDVIMVKQALKIKVLF